MSAFEGHIQAVSQECSEGKSIDLKLLEAIALPLCCLWEQHLFLCVTETWYLSQLITQEQERQEEAFSLEDQKVQ